MRTSLSEIKQLEDFLSGKVSAENKLLMEARLLVDKDLQEKYYWQKMTYLYIKHYSKGKLKAEISSAEKKLFSEPLYAGFRKKVLSIFK